MNPETEMKEEELNARFEAIDPQIGSGVEATRARIERVIHEETLRLQRRWGLVSDDDLRQIVEAIMQEAYGGRVTEVMIDGEQYHRIVTDKEHILLELATRTKPDIIKLLERKRTRYIEQTGIIPTRMILATAQVHYTVVKRLEKMEIEVVQPEVLFDNDESLDVED